MRFLIMFLAALLCVCVASGVRAGPALDRLNQNTDSLLKGKDENLIRQYHAIRTAHGVLHSVEDVKKLMDRATLSCGKTHPALKEKIDNGFFTWREQVDPVLLKGRTRLDKMIDLQGVGSPSSMRAHLKLVDAAFRERNDAMALIPATDRSTCEELIKNMRRTQDDLAQLIHDTLRLDEELIITPTP